VIGVTVVTTLVLGCGDSSLRGRRSGDGNNGGTNNGGTNNGGTNNGANNGGSNNGSNNGGTNNGGTNNGGTNNGGTNNGGTNNGGTNNGQVCVPNASVCVDGTSASVCNADGSAMETVACGDGAICDAELQACAALICEPDAPLGCQDPTLRVVCNAYGTARNVEACEGATRCVSGECLGGAGSCSGDDDCNSDHYCQVGVCLPYGTGPRPGFNTGCLQSPYEGAFAPAVQCRWEGGQVIMQPAVIDLDGDETPEIIFTYWNQNDYAQAYLIAIRGDNCQVAYEAPLDATLHAEGSIAVGDINADGVPEVVGLTRDGIVRAYNNHLQPIWTSQVSVDSRSWGGPAIADLDRDGMPEVIHGGFVLNGENGTLQFNANLQRYAFGSLTAIADVDLDGDNELVQGNRVIGPTGVDETTAAMAALQNGHVAIADFDPTTPEPEIAVVFDGNQVRVQRLSGEVIFGPYAVPNPQSHGGAPNIGDFDGDGRPEIGTAGANNYAVFDLDCVGNPLPAGCAAQGILWFKPTRDASSGATGSSLFDFEGDGRAEVVYNDECFMRVYDGETGQVRFAQANTTNTTCENPVVVDVDGDFNSEIVIPANDLTAPCAPDSETGTPPTSNRGIVVLRDITDRWVNSRPIWNQHTYHITNVENDGHIPQHEVESWRGFNSYRQNAQQEGKALDAPDLTASSTTSPITRGACGGVQLAITVYNRGSQPVSSGIPVSFFTAAPDQGGLLICTAYTTTRLDPGQGEEVGCLWASAPNTASTVHVIADAAWVDGRLVEHNTECFELNNWAVAEVPACQ